MLVLVLVLLLRLLLLLLPLPFQRGLQGFAGFCIALRSGVVHRNFVLCLASASQSSYA